MCATSVFQYAGEGQQSSKNHGTCLAFSASEVPSAASLVDVRGERRTVVSSWCTEAGSQKDAEIANRDAKNVLRQTINIMTGEVLTPPTQRQQPPPPPPPPLNAWQVEKGDDDDDVEGPKADDEDDVVQDGKSDQEDGVEVDVPLSKIPGSFKSSCEGCTIVMSTLELVCSTGCMDTNGNRKPSRISIAKCALPPLTEFGNNNGVLACEAPKAPKAGAAQPPPSPPPPATPEPDDDLDDMEIKRNKKLGSVSPSHEQKVSNSNDMADELGLLLKFVETHKADMVRNSKVSSEETSRAKLQPNAEPAAAAQVQPPAKPPADSRPAPAAKVAVAKVPAPVPPANAGAKGTDWIQ